MRYSLGHVLAIIALVAIALSLRSTWISLEDDTFTLLAVIVISVLCGAYAGWFKARLIIQLFASLGAAVTLSSVFSLERVFHSPDVMFPRTRIATFYFDDPFLNLMSVVMHSAIAATIGTLAGYLVSRYHDWLTCNLANLKIIVAVSLAFGYTGFLFGTLAFQNVTPLQMAFLSGILGGVFGVAWVSSYRSFPTKISGPDDAG